MSEATLIYPHQLFKSSPALSKDRAVYLIEEPLILTYNPTHLQKLIFHKLTLDYYENWLREIGYPITRIDIKTYPTTEDVFNKIKQDGIEMIHIVDTTDDYLEKAIKNCGLKRIFYESPSFILSKEESIERYIKSQRKMSVFYQRLRLNKNILIESDGKPTGGRWSFDADNRKSLPKDLTTPPEPTSTVSQELIAEATDWARELGCETYGQADNWLPTTHKEAEKFFKEFLRLRLQDFGPYEDAIDTAKVRLFHSALSPLLNSGLLTPTLVLEETLSYAKDNHIKLNSLEGFVRQILGWREFIRASYVADGGKMRKQNFFNHQNKLPKNFWQGTTGIGPLDHSIGNALKYGYTHHIERLMVMGNFMLLSQIHPSEVYRWFMSMYVDAYDWVMVPNVYGMSQFADGGSFATKPYISGSNYLKKMSNHKSGDWENIWTSLYWSFIDQNQVFFNKNHRLSMMPKILNKMDKKQKEAYITTAQAFIKTNFAS